MSTDLERQLPRLAEALERDAPAISVDEILSRGSVAVDVDDLRRPSVSWGRTMSGHDENGEREASLELVPTSVEPLVRRRVALKIVFAVAAAAVLIVALGAIVRVDDGPDPADMPTSTIPTPPTTIAVGPFVGVWLSTDTDGSSQRMEIARSGTDEYEVVIGDETATVACAGGASTLTGVGRLVTDTSLVIAEPSLTCDDGTIPPIGPAPQAQLANLTFDLDAATSELVDSSGVVWQREGSDDELIALSPVTVPGLAAGTSDGMWPQSTLEEVRAAQELADAGDPAYTWQVNPQLTMYEEMTIEKIGQVELVDRFLREVLGWEAYMFNPGWSEGPDGLTDGILPDQRYLKSAPGRTNPLYPPQPDSDEPGQSCAPTIDDLHYESVSVDLVQPDRQGRDGIWVVNQWRPTTFTQADPAVLEAQGTERLEEFLAARIAGQGAEGRVKVNYQDLDVPLLYATTSGAPYERYEIERVDAPRWPNASMVFSARLFADGDATVVEQEISWFPPEGRLSLDRSTTTENGQPVTTSHTSSDGEVSVSAPSTWEAWLPGTFGVPVAEGEVVHDEALDVWSGSLWHPEDGLGSGERIELVDPVAYDEWCAANGGSPLLSAPGDAATIAQQLIADPNFETTAPVAARIGGLEAVSIDVALAPGGEACGIGMIDISRWIHASMWEPGWRIRLYLVDLPEGMSVETLAITVVAPEERFGEVIAETTPIIDSIEFHPPAP